MRLKDAGFDVETHPCAICGQHVADLDDFIGGDAVEVMSK